MDAQKHHPIAAQAPLDRRNDFDLVAPIYDWLAAFVFAGNIRRAQLSLLPELAEAKSVLIVGGGSGWFLLELLRALPQAHVVYIEKSVKMLGYSRQLVRRAAPEHEARVDFRLGTQESLSESDGPFDVVVTNFFLDLFDTEKSAAIAAGLSRRFSPSGRWLFTDFKLPERGFLRLYARVLFKVMFTFFNVFSSMESRKPPDYDQILGRIGLTPVKVRTFYGTMIHAQLLMRF